MIHSGETFLLDTSGTQILGGPGGAPVSTQSVKTGRVFVRDLTIEKGGVLRAMGPYPLRICASGDVTIRGLLNADGFDAHDVVTLNTGSIPERGGPGGPGGGRGGDSSTRVKRSTPAGSFGRGPIEGQYGGGGGESSYAPAALGKDARRPGGGGRFAADVDPTRWGLFAEAGFPGHSLGTGALTGSSPAPGGVAGTGPFVDGDPDNDFFGIRAIPDPVTGTVRLVRGELDHLQGGYGCGGGGDAIPASMFPPMNWTSAHDEKGGAGGGGGGAVHIRALGRIVFGNEGRISAVGGQGGLGENTMLLDHIGGTGGSGSGGMIVLETATQIDFTDGDPTTTPSRKALFARGGRRKTGGSNPFGTPIPPNVSYSGTGGPGLIQIHLPLRGQTPSFTDPNAALVLPAAAMFSPDPLGEVSSPTAIELLPGVDG
ncbi:MAG TPA: hypothetical protein ENJ09_02795 [Planctomycetes bacterium]|nr:hypothetical protein [Planctomycetota bacterium]